MTVALILNVTDNEAKLTDKYHIVFNTIHRYHQAS